jgi:hypothetical protein
MSKQEAQKAKLTCTACDVHGSDELGELPAAEIHIESPLEELRAEANASAERITSGG